MNSLPPAQRFDMNLINALLVVGCSVANFPILKYWLDIGQHADYSKAQEDVKMWEEES